MPEQLYLRPNNRLRDSDLERSPTSGLLEPAVLLEYYACCQNNGTSEGGPGPLAPVFATQVAGAAVGPDGAMSAFKLIEDANNIYHSTHANQPNAVDGNPATMTIYIKAGTRTKIWMGPTYSSAGNFGIFDLVAGTWAGPAPSNVAMIDSGNGWWRMDMSYTYAAGNEQSVGMCDASGNVSYQGDGASYILLFRYNDFSNYKNGSSGILYTGNSTGGPVPPGFPNTPPQNIYGTGRAIDSPWAIPFASAPQLSYGLLGFIERGTIANAGRGIFQIGSHNATGARLYVVSTASGYSVVHNNGSGSVASTLAVSPKSGDLVQIRWTLGSNGSVQIFQSINLGAETSGALSGANALAGSWAEPWIFLGSLGITNVTGGYMAFREMLVVSGTFP